MTSRRLLALLALLALVIAPFGGMASVEAMASKHNGPVAMTGHCDETPGPAQGTSDKKAIDCMIACAVMTPPAASTFQAVGMPASVPVRGVLPVFAGRHPEADPPPPRIS